MRFLMRYNRWKCTKVHTCSKSHTRTHTDMPTHSGAHGSNTNTVTKSTHANKMIGIIRDSPAAAVVDSLSKVPVRKKAIKTIDWQSGFSKTNFASSQLESCSPSREDEEVGSNASLFPLAPTQQCILLAPQHTTLHEHSLCSHTHHTVPIKHTVHIFHKFCPVLSLCKSVLSAKQCKYIFCAKCCVFLHSIWSC